MVSEVKSRQLALNKLSRVYLFPAVDGGGDRNQPATSPKRPRAGKSRGLTARRRYVAGALRRRDNTDPADIHSGV